jgi:aspartate 1-decarboxylase
MRWFLRSKIHKATVTAAKLNYVGSIGLDKGLIERVGILPGEKILVVDNTNGARLETYVIEEEKDSGSVAIYGAAAKLIKKGDQVILMGFELADRPVKIKNILVDKNNKFVKFLQA